MYPATVDVTDREALRDRQGTENLVRTLVSCRDRVETCFRCKMPTPSLLDQAIQASNGEVNWDAYFDHKATIGWSREWLDEVAKSPHVADGVAVIEKGLLEKSAPNALFKKYIPCCVVSTRFRNEVKIPRKSGDPLNSYLLMSKLMSYAITRLGIGAYNPNDQNVSAQHGNESQKDLQSRLDGRWLWIYQLFCKYVKEGGGVMVQLIPASSDPKYDGFSDMMKAERNLAQLLNLRIVEIRFEETDSEETLKRLCAEAMPSIRANLSSRTKMAVEGLLFGVGFSEGNAVSSE